MGFFGSLTKAVIDTVSIPVAVIKDVVTLGGTIEGKNTTYTGDKIRDIGADIDEAKDAL